MKKFTLFFSIALLTLLTLTSCNKKEEVEENATVVKTETWVENKETSTWTEDQKTLENVNSEVDQVINDIEGEVEKSWSDTGSTWTVKKLNQMYKTPGWDDEVAFSIKMKWDKIENVMVETVKWSEISTKMMKSFWDWINSVIVWKTIEEAKNISVVGWASLTTNAFKDALKNM